MKLLTTAFFTAITCSRDGEAFAEGLVWLIKWLTIFTVSFCYRALVGHCHWSAQRQGKILAADRPASGGRGGVSGHRCVDRPIFIWNLLLARCRPGQTGDAILDAWVAPIKNPVPGELDRALAAVVDADIAKDPGRRGQLISFLPDHLEKIDSPLNDKERRALIDVATRLRLENAQLASGHAMKVSIESTARWRGCWKSPIFRRAPGMRRPQAVHGRRHAIRRALVQSSGGRCRSGFTAERLNAAWDLMKTDQSAMFYLENIRHQARGIPAGPTRSPWPTPHS
jgi:hypothetical protein